MGKKILIMGSSDGHARAIAQMVERLRSDAEFDVRIDASDDRKISGRKPTTVVHDEITTDVTFAELEEPAKEQDYDFKTRNKSDRKRNRANRWR